MLGSILHARSLMACYVKSLRKDLHRRVPHLNISVIVASLASRPMDQACQQPQVLCGDSVGARKEDKRNACPHLLLAQAAEPECGSTGICKPLEDPADHPRCLHTRSPLQLQLLRQGGSPREGECADCLHLTHQRCRGPPHEPCNPCFGCALALASRLSQRQLQLSQRQLQDHAVK